MYCTNCGREITEGTTICPSCGARQASRSEAMSVKTMNTGITITQVNQATVNAIYHLLEPLRKIADENRKVNNYQRYIHANERKAKDIVGTVLLGSVIGFFPANFLFGTGAAIMCGLIGGLIGFGIHRSNMSALEQNKQGLTDSLNRIDGICKEIDEDEICLLPPSYRFYNAASFFYNAFINQRALTMQQAVNLYEDEMRKDQMARMQQQQMAALGAIQRSSSVTATMSTLNFISKLF